MQITLFRAFPDPYRKSMQVYADHVRDGVRALLGKGENLAEYLPRRVRLQPRVARLWDQYVGYQMDVRGAQGDVNHIIDHSFGHLAHSLDPRRTVVTFHDATVFKAADGGIGAPTVSRKTLWSLRYSVAAIRKAAAVIADSEVSRRDFIGLTRCAAEKIHVVHPGINPNFHAAADRDSLKARYGLVGRHILHIGHNLFYMNVEGVLRVLAHVVRRLGVEVKLLKVGMPLTDAQMELARELQVDNRIVFLGRLAADELAAVYNCADVLLYPVLYTGFGLPPLEAMASGTPVVCSNRGSLPEIVGDAAMTADPKNDAQMASQIAALLSDRAQWDSYRSRGFEQARRFSWEQASRKILSIYRDVHESACSRLQ